MLRPAWTTIQIVQNVIKPPSSGDYEVMLNLKLTFPYRKQYELFDQPDQRERREKINVESFREKMSRARLLDNTPEYPIMRRLDKNTMPASKQPRRRHSLVLADELAVVGKKVVAPKGPEITVDPSPNQRRRLPLVVQKGSEVVERPPRSWRSTILRSFRNFYLSWSTEKKENFGFFMS